MSLILAMPSSAWAGSASAHGSPRPRRRALGSATGLAGLGGRGGADRIQRVGPAGPAPVLPASAVDLHDPHTSSDDVVGEAGAVAAGAFDADQAHRPEPAKPFQ